MLILTLQTKVSMKVFVKLILLFAFGDKHIDTRQKVIFYL